LYHNQSFFNGLTMKYVVNLVQRIDTQKWKILQDQFYEVLLFLKSGFKVLGIKSMKLCKIVSDNSFFVA
jgi:hypothetical protein